MSLFDIKVNYESIIVEEAKNAPLNKDNIIKQISKLNDTPYFINNINIDMDDNIYINIKTLNELRRNIISLLED